MQILLFTAGDGLHLTVTPERARSWPGTSTELTFATHHDQVLDWMTGHSVLDLDDVRVAERIMDAKGSSLPGVFVLRLQQTHERPRPRSRTLMLL